MRVWHFIRATIANIELYLRAWRSARRDLKIISLLAECRDCDTSEVVSSLDAVLLKQKKMERFELECAEFDVLLRRSGHIPLKRVDVYPCLDDRTAETGFDRHYIYHPAWAARILAKSPPRKHIDISSVLYFATIVSAFIEVEFFDYRPAPLYLSNLTSSSADVTNLPFESESVESLSCMHVIEHIGLGRYGDPFDVEGDKKAARELTRVLTKNGQLIIAVPVGRPRIQFNAHRIYSHEQVLEMFPELSLLEHALVPDGVAEDGLILNPSSELIMAQSYGCGCYVFSKLRKN